MWVKKWYGYVWDKTSTPAQQVKQYLAMRKKSVNLTFKTNKKAGLDQPR